MNKNWLYRVLALALVAMLALPVFAMAEEMDEFQLGGEVVEVVSKDVDLANEWIWLDGELVYPIDMDSNRNYKLEVDIAEDAINYWVINAAEENDLYDYDFWTDFAGFSSYKSSNHKVATIDKHGHITIKAKGKSTITLKGKNSDGKTKTQKIALTVKNGDEPKKVVIRKANGDKASKTEEIALGTVIDNALIWTTEVEDKNGDVIPVAKPSGKAKLKSANSDNVDVDYADYDVDEETGVIDGAIFTNRWLLDVDTSKTHSTKLTATSYVNSKLKATTTIKVVKRSKENVVKKQLELELEKAKDQDSLLIGVKDIKIDRVGKTFGVITDWYYTVTLYICNGTGHTIKKIVPDGTNELECTIGTVTGSLADLAKGGLVPTIVGTIYKGKDWSVNWKNNKVSTEKVTLHTSILDGKFKSDHPVIDLKSKTTEVKVVTFPFHEKGNSYVVYKDAE